MGDFRIVIEACGGHGCDRGVKAGGTVNGCGLMGCPDCEARRFVARLQASGVNVYKAELVHWPADCVTPSGPVSYPKEREVRDDLLTRIRFGSFAVIAALLLGALALWGGPAAAQAAPAPAVACPAGSVPVLVDGVVKCGELAKVAPASARLPAAPQVDPSTVPNADADPMGFVSAVFKAIANKQWLMLIPLGLVGAIAAIRRWGAKLAGGFFLTPRGGAVLALLGALAGALYLTFQLGIVGFVPVLTMAAVIFVTAYPIFKLAGNLLTGSSDGGAAPVAGGSSSGGEVQVPPKPALEVVAGATGSATSALEVAGGKTATELVDEARAPVVAP